MKSVYLDSTYNDRYFHMITVDLVVYLIILYQFHVIQ